MNSSVGISICSTLRGIAQGGAAHAGQLVIASHRSAPLHLIRVQIVRVRKRNNSRGPGLSSPGQRGRASPMKYGSPAGLFEPAPNWHLQSDAAQRRRNRCAPPGRCAGSQTTHD